MHDESTRTASGVDLFGLAMSQATVGIFLSEPDGRFIDVNEAAARMVGRTVEDLRTMSALDLTSPDGSDTPRRALIEVARGDRDSYSDRRRWVRPDGSIAVVDVTVSGVRDTDGDVVMLLAQAVDVTGYVEARGEAEAAGETLRGVIDSLLDPWVLLAAVRDADGVIVDFAYRDANDAACAANGLSWEELMGTTLLELLPGHLGSGLFQQYADVVESGTPLELDDSPYGSELGDGRIRYFDNRAVKVGDGISFTWRDVTERVEQRQRLARQALTDPLTGLANRQRLLDALDETCPRVAAGGGSAALLYCDLDGLKAINDSLGHEAGDIVLRAVGDRMRGAVRTADVVARMGGDEFVVLAEGIRDDASAMALALKVADAVTRPLLVAGEEILPRISSGVAVCTPGCTPADLLRRADEALYRDKRSGR
ncbi:MAG: diguanylate cyclase [Candidatus Nanopelagicales bacterium]